MCSCGSHIEKASFIYTGTNTTNISLNSTLTLSGLNETYSHLPQTTDSASAQSSALLPSASLYTSPYTSDGVQRARPLPPGQPLPMGVAAVALAMPV